MYLFGNWKMNNTLEESVNFSIELINQLREKRPKSKIAIFPNAVCLPMMRELLEEEEIGLGSQNFHHETEGPFTGETSLKQVQEFIQYALVGHSERRKSGDTLEIIRKKLELLNETNISPVLCISDPKDIPVLLTGQSTSLFSHLIIAFEPPALISDGKTFKKVPTPEEIDEQIEIFEKELAKVQSTGTPQVPFMYGASVNADNVEELLKSKKNQGFLMGQASVKFESFWKVVEKVEEKE